MMSFLTRKGIIIPELIFFILVLFSGSAQAKPSISARAAFLMDATTGEVLYEKNPDLPLPPASTTKVMTAIIALENSNLDAMVRATHEASRVQPCKIEVRPGEKWCMGDLLRCILLNSANDASVVVAEGTAGSVKNFTHLMNLKAKEIGALNSHFANPHGLDQKDHYSTARDLVLIFKYAMTNPIFRELVQIESMTIRGPNQRLIYLRNHNKLLGRFEGMLGGKTGYTRRAGKCFVGEARRNGKVLLVSVLGSQNHFRDVTILLNYGFNQTKTLEATQFLRSPSSESLIPSLTYPRNYVLQVASFSDPIKAQELKQMLADQGYPSFIEPVNLKSGITFHRVKIGFYHDLASAQKTKANIAECFGFNSLILHQEGNKIP